MGGPGLKQTQMYTPEFGRAMAGWWMADGPVTAGTEHVMRCVSGLLFVFWVYCNAMAGFCRRHPRLQERATAVVSCAKCKSIFGGHEGVTGD